MQSGKAQVQKKGGHAVEDQKQIKQIQLVKKPFRISLHQLLQSGFIHTVYHLLVKNNKGEWGGLERDREPLTFFP